MEALEIRDVARDVDRRDLASTESDRLERGREAVEQGETAGGLVAFLHDVAVGEDLSLLNRNRLKRRPFFGRNWGDALQPSDERLVTPSLRGGQG